MDDYVCLVTCVCRVLLTLITSSVDVSFRYCECRNRLLIMTVTFDIIDLTADVSDISIFCS